MDDADLFLMKFDGEYWARVGEDVYDRPELLVSLDTVTGKTYKYSNEYKAVDVTKNRLRQRYRG